MIKWEEIARSRGFTKEDGIPQDPMTQMCGDPKAMLEALYKEHKSINAIAAELLLSTHTVRVAFERFGVEVKSQGGPQNVKFDVTEDLLDEIERSSITAVARRLNVDYTAVYKRTKEPLRKRREQRAADEQSSAGLPDEKGTPHRDENR